MKWKFRVIWIAFKILENEENSDSHQIQIGILIVLVVESFKFCEIWSFLQDSNKNLGFVDDSNKKTCFTRLFVEMNLSLK